MDRDLMRKWAQMREDAYEQAKLSGLSPKDIAEKIGTSASNVTNLVRRGSHTSPFSGPIDALLREAVAEYDSQLNDLSEAASIKDPPTELGNLLMSYARVLRDSLNSIEYKMETIETLFSHLKSFIKHHPRLTEKEKEAD